MTEQFEPALRRLLWDLRDYLPDLIVVGGWVPYLYQRYGGFPGWTGAISLTGEVDVLVGPRAQGQNRPPLEELLRASGFEPIEGTQGAAWQRDPAVGEKIEFLIPNTGTQRQEGSPQPVPGQAGVAAVALDDLRLLERHTTTLNIPLTVAGAPPQQLTIRVPTLGAYVVNKAITFIKRRTVVVLGVPVGNPKRGKDLLYLYDVLAGGAEVADRVSADVEAMGGSDPAAPLVMRQAAGQLRMALRDRSAPLVECEAMLMERDGFSRAEAGARLTGYLTDLIEIIETHAV